jgi:hypothetical protein
MPSKTTHVLQPSCWSFFVLILFKIIIRSVMLYFLSESCRPNDKYLLSVRNDHLEPICGTHIGIKIQWWDTYRPKNSMVILKNTEKMKK